MSALGTTRACIACDDVYDGPLRCPRCGEPGEPLPQGRSVNDGDEVRAVLVRLLAAVDAPREADGVEVGMIESAVRLGRLDGIVAEVPPEVRWFVAPGGFAGLVGGTLCRCWVAPDSRGNGIGGALYRLRVEAAKGDGATALTVIVRGKRQFATYRTRGFRLTARLNPAPDGTPRALMGRLL